MKARTSGATLTDIVEAEGIGRTLASHTANSPECRQLIADFVNESFPIPTASNMRRCPAGPVPSG